MLSQARKELNLRLKDFDEIMTARDAICPANAGRPAKKQGTQDPREYGALDDNAVRSSMMESFGRCFGLRGRRCLEFVHDLDDISDQHVGHIT